MMTLKVEPGSNGIGEGAVAPLLVRRRAERVRIERGPDRESQDLARARIHHDGHRRLGARAPPGGLDLLLGQVLERGVDGQRDALSRHGRLEDDRRARDVATESVALDERPAFGPCQVGVPCLLDTAQALAVEPLEADDVGAQLTARVEAQALLEESQPRLVQVAHGLRHGRRQLALDPDEALGRIEAAGDVGRGLAEDRRELAPRGAERRRCGGAARRATRRWRTPPAPGPRGRRSARAWAGARPSWRAGSRPAGSIRRA